MDDLLDILPLVFDHVAPPPDATEVDDWSLRDDTQLDDETRGFSRFFHGTVRSTSRGVEVAILGHQWPDGSADREIIVNDKAVGGYLTRADAIELVVELAEAVEEMSSLATGDVTDLRSAAA
jgi:hypothetical protein